MLKYNFMSISLLVFLMSSPIKYNFFHMSAMTDQNETRQTITGHSVVFVYFFLYPVYVKCYRLLFAQAGCLNLSYTTCLSNHEFYTSTLD